MSATNDLLSNYQHVISGLTLVPGSKGVFDVRVNDSVMYSKHETDRHANPGEVLALFEDLLDPDVQRYGT